MRLQAFEDSARCGLTLPLFYGTPKKPHAMGQCIGPRQNYTTIPGGAIFLERSRPAVIVSRSVSPRPVIRSLLNHTHPVLRRAGKLPLIFKHEVSKSGELCDFVGAAALRTLREHNAVGHVYACEGARLRPPIEDWYGPDELWFGEWLWLHGSTHTTVKDLPASLTVVDASAQKTWEFLCALSLHDSVQGLAEERGVAISPLAEFMQS